MAGKPLKHLFLVSEDYLQKHRKIPLDASIDEENLINILTNPKLPSHQRLTLFYSYITRQHKFQAPRSSPPSNVVIQQQKEPEKYEKMDIPMDEKKAGPMITTSTNTEPIKTNSVATNIDLEFDNVYNPFSPKRASSPINTSHFVPLNLYENLPLNKSKIIEEQDQVNLSAEQGELIQNIRETLGNDVDVRDLQFHVNKSNDESYLSGENTKTNERFIVQKPFSYLRRLEEKRESEKRAKRLDKELKSLRTAISPQKNLRSGTKRDRLSFTNMWDDYSRKSLGGGSKADPLYKA